VWRSTTLKFRKFQHDPLVSAAFHDPCDMAALPAGDHHLIGFKIQDDKNYSEKIYVIFHARMHLISLIFSESRRFRVQIDFHGWRSGIRRLSEVSGGRYAARLEEWNAAFATGLVPLGRGRSRRN
jgi:hypothetical protein